MGAKSSKFLKIPEFLSRKLSNSDNESMESKDAIRLPELDKTPNHLNELNINTTDINNEGEEHVFRDPRSPTTFISRTPIVFDSDQSKSFVFAEDDSFNDLFNPNPTTPQIAQPQQEIEKKKNDDPRSPTLEIDRTPLSFDTSGESMELELPPLSKTDNEIDEDELIKSIINMVTSDISKEEKPVHKQIERIKNMHKKKKPTSKSKSNRSTLAIYQDSNVFYSTPKKGSLADKFSSQNDSNKRTPLGCVGNKLRVKSKSVENVKMRSKKNDENLFDENFTKLRKRVTVFEYETGDSLII